MQVQLALKSIKAGFLHKPIVQLLLIIIAGFIAYSNTFQAPFHFDDTPNIVENYTLRDLSNFWPPSGSRWFGFLTFALNYYFGGLNVTGYHIVNLAIHILNAILVYWLVVFTFRTPYFKVSVISASEQTQKTDTDTVHYSPIHPFTHSPLFIALLFASHPLQTQAVTYIVQRFASLATLFYLLSLVMYIKFRMQDAGYRIQDVTPLNPPLPRGEVKGGIMHRASWILYLCSLLSAILAMKTKEIAFTLPVVVALYEFMFFEGKFKKKILYLLPLLLTMLIIPLSLVSIDKPIGDAIGELREAAQETEEISKWSYLFTQFRVIVTYIRLLFLPINQNLDYDYPVYHSLFTPSVFLSFLLLLSIFGLGIYLLYRSRLTKDDRRQTMDESSIISRPSSLVLRLISFGIFWFLITLSVESSIIPIRDVIFEHRLYLPSVGAAIAFSIAIFYVLQFTVHGSRFLLAAVVIALSIATYQRNIVWKDEVSLWEDVVRKSPNKARGYNNLGAWGYYNRGWINEAIQAYQIALRLRPDFALAHNNMGVAYDKKGMLDLSIQKFQIALRLKPDYAEAHYNLGVAYDKKGMLNEAIQEFQIALRLKPDFAKAHYNLGAAYDKKGMLDLAIQEFQIALRLEPDYAEAHNNLGVAYVEKGMLNEAIQAYQTALRLKPDFAAETHNNLGFAYWSKGLTDKAMEHLQIALRLKPDFALAHNNLGRIYLQKGDIDKARREFEMALRLSPNDYNLK